MNDPVIDLLQRLADEMPKHAAELSELDAKLGDGDLGATIESGFKSMSQALNDLRARPVGEQLREAGMAFNRGGASTFGALIATALMQAGRTATDKNGIASQDIPILGRAALQAMMK